MDGDLVTQAGVCGILVAIGAKTVWEVVSRRNGTAPLTRKDFGTHCTVVEAMFKDDPPRRHTELLQELIRETKFLRHHHGKKLDAIVTALGKLNGGK